jgi:hypothetical protein
MKALEEAASMMRGLVDGSVRSQYAHSTALINENLDRSG